MRKLATIRIVNDITPIPNADNIETLHIDGWQVVANKGLYQIRDKVIYCEIDSVLPEKPEFEFLKSRHFRIKTIKLKGQLSQGIVFPLSILRDKKYSTDIRENPIYNFNLGDDVTELLEIKKYEPQIPVQLQGMVKGSFPNFIPKTDEERIQNIPSILDIFKYHTFYVTEKLDGTSMTCYLYNGDFGVCSRNLELKETEDNIYWKIARQLKIKDILSSHGDNIAIQGELIGEGIQGNKYKIKGHQLRIFDIFDISTEKYLEYYDKFVFILKHNLISIPLVGFFTLNHTMESILLYANGASTLNPDISREGLVLRATPETYYTPLGRVSFKVISNQYLLKQKE